MLKDSKSLEISCYVLCAGAFGIFFRWMQLMLAYNEESLVDSSFWNVLLPILIIASAVMFYRFANGFEKSGQYLPNDFCLALVNPGKFYSAAGIAAGVIMVIGAGLLVLKCEVDKNANFLFVLAGTAVLSGISFPFLLASANKPHVENRNRIALLAFFPILQFSVWILVCYKQNSTNSVGWDYIVELLAIVIALIAFFRVAGFAFGVSDAKKSMFFCMLGAMLCLTCLADNRYLGQQVMFVSAAIMLILYNWIMIANLRTHKKQPVATDDNGFEYLDV